MIAQNYNVYAFDITEPENTQDHNFLKINLLERESLDSINWNVDFVFFFAGLTGTKISFKDYSDLSRLKSSALVLEKFGLSAAQNRILEYFDEKNIS